MPTCRQIYIDFFFDNIRYFSEYFRSLSTSIRWITKIQPDRAHARRPTYVFTLWRYYGKIFFVDRYNDHISKSESMHFIQKINPSQCYPIYNFYFQFRGYESADDILAEIAHCTEFSEFYLRRNEKKTLNSLDLIKNGDIKTIQQKVVW